jgi:hypothetical protein
MAKAKQSRKARKQELEKRAQQEEAASSPAATAPEVADQPQVDTPAPVSEEKSTLMRKAVDFAEEYYYVYTDLRNISIVSVVMFALMFALGYFI